MKLNKIIKTIIFLVFVGLFALPIVLMMNMSRKEQEEAVQDRHYEFKEVAYGEIMQVYRKDVDHYINLSGEVTSDSYEFIELNVDATSVVRVTVGVNSEIHKGQVVAYVNSRPVISECNGVVEEINYDFKGYIKVHTFDELVVRCSVAEEDANILMKSDKLKTENGIDVSVVRVSNIHSDGCVDVFIKTSEDTFGYGQIVPEFRVYTGNVYKKTLVVDKDCVYRRKENGPSYVRLVDANGYFIEERQVSISYESDDVICVTNLEEGAFCDSGYKKIVDVSEK